MAPISCAVQPASAKTRAAALRSPCAEQVREARLIAPVTEPMTKCRGPERRAKSRYQERQMIARARGDDGGQCRMHRNGERGAGLLLRQVNCPAADMLRTHADDIAPALARIEQQS